MDTMSGIKRCISQVSMYMMKSSNSGEDAWREVAKKYRGARYTSRRQRKRVVFKHGDCNVVQWNVAKRRRRYLQDIFTTLVDAQWRWTLLVFALNFLLSWLGFALVWWLIIFTHGDLNPESLRNGTEPCLTNVQSFTGCFLFSVETQHTIGYGGRVTTEQCPEAIFVMCLQSIVGVFIQAFMVGIVFAKLSRPKKRAQTLLYSRNAVICLRDGQLCLMFRVGDMRKSHIVEAHIRAQVIRRKVTREGEILPFYQQEMKVGADGEEDRLMFIWPMTIVHKINERSPLYNLSAADMLKERFEIVVMLEGVIESTGMTTQARSSYLPTEVFWGHRFEPMVSFGKETEEYEVDYMKFNDTYEVDTPLCSAKQLDELRATVSTSQKLDRLVGITKTFSNDTLQDLSSVESMSLDEHIEIKIPDARVRENRLLAQQQHDAHYGQYAQNGHHSTSNYLMPPSESSANLTQVAIAPVPKPRVPNGSVHHYKEHEKEQSREHKEHAREHREQMRDHAREQKEQVRAQGKAGNGGMRRSPSAQFKMMEEGTTESPPPPYPSHSHQAPPAPTIFLPPPITVTAPEPQPAKV